MVRQERPPVTLHPSYVTGKKLPVWGNSAPLPARPRGWDPRTVSRPGLDLSKPWRPVLEEVSPGYDASEPAKICQASADFATRLRIKYAFSPNA